MTELRLLVCGGRTYCDRDRVFDVLDRLAPKSICHGGAHGADELAGLWARARGIYCQVFPADWQAFGRKAGFIRNKVMLESFEPNLVVAFPGGRGTESMMTLARAAHVRVMQVT